MAEKETKLVGERPSVIRRQITKNVKHVFTREELNGIADDMSRAIRDARQRDDHRKEVARQLAAEVSEAEARGSKAAEKHAQGYEFRDVECEEVRDYNTRTVTTVRLDTQEVIDHRPMRTDETQMPLELPEPRRELEGMNEDEKKALGIVAGVIEEALEAEKETPLPKQPAKTPPKVTEGQVEKLREHFKPRKGGHRKR